MTAPAPPPAPAHAKTAPGSVSASAVRRMCTHWELDSSSLWLTWLCRSSSGRNCGQALRAIAANRAACCRRDSSAVGR